MNNKIGFMQGRLSDFDGERIQFFPAANWQNEILIAGRLGFKLMEWTLDSEGLAENPLMTERGRMEISKLCDDSELVIESVTGDCFMQRPFWKFTGPEREVELFRLKEVIHSCYLASIKILVIPLVDNGSVASESEKTSLINGLFSLCSVLRQTGVRIAFESDYDPPALRDMINVLDPMLFGINYDIGNSASLGFDPELEFAKIGDRIINVHIKDRVLGGGSVSLGAGNANFDLVFKLLQEFSYSGNLILQTARCPAQNHAEALLRSQDFVGEKLRSL